MQTFKMLQSDYNAFKSIYPNVKIFRLPAFKVLLFFRIGVGARKKHIPILPSLCSAMLRIIYGIEVSYKAHIGIGVNFVHPVGITIGDAVIGDRCSFYGNNTLGSRYENDLPKLGKNIEVGAGARILGSIKIGDNSKIGANAVVLKDVPTNSIAVGVPARIQSQNKQKQIK